MKSMEGMMFMFNPDRISGGGDDEYNSSYTPQEFCAGTLLAGTMFEETRCREKEHLATPTFIDVDDWSFDHTNEVQGKQWKN